MRQDNVNGPTLKEFTQKLAEEASRQGFVLVDGEDLDPAQFFANDNDKCDCPPGMCLADEAEDAGFEEILEPVINAMEDAFLDSIEAEAIHNRREAVAQLGRILEVQSLAVERHARLVEEVLSDI